MTWSRFLPAGAFVILVIFLGIGLTRDPSVLPTEMIDRDLPAFDLPELREDDVRLTREDIIGRTALVNVFGSWCVACLQEHPTFMALARDDTVRIVGVNWRDKQDDALTWLARHGDPYETVIFDKDSDLAIELGVTGAPETFIVDASGRIRYKYIGPITPSVWRETIRPVLDVLETEAPRQPARSDAPLSAAALEQPVLTDAALIAARTEAVSKTLRCVVCQNQSIFDSQAPLALDMKRLVEKRIVAGDSDEEVRAYLSFRYGDYVLMNPPFQLNTVLLWSAPLLLLLTGGVWFLVRPKPQHPPADAALSEDDRARIRAALTQTDGPS